MDEDLDESLLCAIDKTFPPRDRDAVAEALKQADGGDQVRGAVLVIAYGDKNRITELVSRSQYDPRNVLMLLKMVDLSFPDLNQPEIARRYNELGVEKPKFF